MVVACGERACAAFQVLDAARAETGSFGELLLSQSRCDAVSAQGRSESHRFGRHAGSDLLVWRDGNARFRADRAIWKVVTPVAGSKRRRRGTPAAVH
jgi:hypothetical protein